MRVASPAEVGRATGVGESYRSAGRELFRCRPHKAGPRPATLKKKISTPPSCSEGLWGIALLIRVWFG